ALGVESAFGEEGIGAGRDGGGHAVGRKFQPVPAGGGGTGASARWVERNGHLLLGEGDFALVGAGFGTGFGGGLGELAACGLAAGAVGAVGGEQRAGGRAAGATGGPVAHRGPSILRVVLIARRAWHGGGGRGGGCGGGRSVRRRGGGGRSSARAGRRGAVPDER